jgi:hypothetical protein
MYRVSGGPSKRKSDFSCALLGPLRHVRASAKPAMHEDFVFQALVFIILSSNEIYPRAKQLALQEQATAARTT